MATALTTSARRVLRRLLDAEGDVFGEDVGRAAGLPSGAVYPVLARFELDGWLASTWAGDAESQAPARRVYRLTEEGRARGWNALQRSGS